MPLRLVTFAAVLSGVAFAQDPVDPLELPGAYVREPKRETTAKPASPQPCAIETSLVASREGDRVHLEARVTNVGTRRVTFELANRCPAPPFEVVGLPAGVEPFETCAAGPCLASAPVPFTLRPGETRSLGAAVLSATATSCSAPLPGGQHVLEAKITLAKGAARVCTRTTTVVGFERARPAPAPAPRAPQARCQPVACGPCPSGAPHVRSPDGCPSCSCPPPLGLQPGGF